MSRGTYSDLTLILPTLNEFRTVPIIVKSALKEFPGIRVMVVDDGSTDGTVEAVEKLSNGNGNVRLFNRKRRGLPPGLTASIIDGISASRTKYVAVMDADMQHPLSKIRDVSRLLRNGSSLVVCTRSTVKDWPLERVIVSKTLSSMAYLVLVVRGKKRCGDIFSGFFGMEKKRIYGIVRRNKRRFIGGGYKFLFDLLKCIASDSDIRIGEVPYDFGNRKFGASKAGAIQVVALLRSFFT